MPTLLREIAGWLLLLLGLVVFYLCYSLFLTQKRVIESVPVLLIGFWVFRAGLQLLKVAMASRAYREARNLGRNDAPASAPRVSIAMGNPKVTPRSSPVPGPATTSAGRGN
ncbi:MAG: hypothetical protein ACRCZF_17835 [Gemmataceae bacterium]